MYQKITAATLCGALTLFLAGGLIFEVVLKSWMTENIKAMGDCVNISPNMLHIILANLVLALLFSTVLYKFGISTFRSGAIAAAWIAFLLVIWFDVWMFATFHFMTTQMFLMDVVTQTLMGALAGGVIGWVLGKVKSA